MSDASPGSTPATSGTPGSPASVGTPVLCPVRETLDKANESISLVSDVLHCDRAQFLPGSSTDGDVATIQAYKLGKMMDTTSQH